MSNFALLWGKILRSSLWVQESKETRLVWITILALKDVNGIVQSSLIGLADAAKVSVEECVEALEVLKSPDPNDTSKVEEGRRIREVAGGWEVVNNDMYRFSTEEKREMWRKDKADQRARKAIKEESRNGRKKKSKVSIGSGPSARERLYEKQFGDGEDPDKVPSDEEF